MPQLTSPTLSRAGVAEPPGPRPPVGPLGRVAGVSFKHRWRVVLAWVAALALAIGLAAAANGEFSADYSAPGSDSEQAQTLLEEQFPSQSGDTIDVVVRSAAPVTDPAAQQDVSALLDELTSLPHVVGVDDPYTTPSGIAPDGQTLVAHLRLDVVNPGDMPVAGTERIIEAAQAHDGPDFDVALGGQTVQMAEMGEIGSEAIGISAAAIILLITFGSVVAAGLPVMVALAGLAVSSVLVGVVSAVTDVPDWSTALASMMGIGIGIDYVLLMVTRFREWRAAGLDPEQATVATLDTAGRAVLVAGSTVVVSMLGLFAMGLSFARGAAVVTIVAVLVVMAVAVTLFPALLGFFGRWVDRLRLPLGRRRPVHVAAGGHIEPSGGWVRWSRFIERNSVLAALAGVAVLVALALPFLDVRFGFPDAGNRAEDQTTRQAYDMLGDAFGAGANGPLLLAADLDTPGDTADLDRLAGQLSDTPNVAVVNPPLLNEVGDTAIMTVLPTTGPQDEATAGLIDTLRDDVIPAAMDHTGTEVHIGGVTATSIDSTANVASRLPFLISGVVAISVLLLFASFRSIVIPITAAMMNLLSIAAAYGVVALALQGGWFGQLIGIDTATPLPAFIPVIMFAVLFGLSMDYEVFLVSRMRESWERHAQNSRAIVSGLAGTGRVITAAAAIMVAVFAAFVPGPTVMLKVIGVGMAAAILVDATVVRLLLVPAVMQLLGRANWWLPTWLDRRLPQLHVEGRPDAYLSTRDAEAPIPALVGS